MGIVKAIGKGPAFLDTSIFIYFIEEDSRYFKLVLPIFEAIDRGQFTAVTSGITLLETLVVPFRAGDFKLADKYEQLLSHSRGMVMCNLNKELLREGAYLRATLGLKTPDALQIAASKQSGCSVFITNDRRLPKIEGLRLIQLSDYLET